MNKRNIGRLGENIFAKMCSEVGITCNPSLEDDEGWDFIIEFDDDKKTFGTFDEKNSGIKCFVQVKSSDSNSNNRITLRNWDKMIKNSYPVFIFRVEFDGSNNAQKAHLIHIDEELISKGLKRLREIDSNMEFLLSKRKMSYPINSDSLLETLDGIGLKAKITESIPDTITKYISSKSNFVQTVGYETEIKFELNVESTKSLTPEDLIIDFALGKTKNLKVDRAEVKSKRFGIKSSNEKLQLTNIFIEIEPTGACTLSLRNLKTNEKETLILDYYLPNNLAKGVLNSTNYRFVLKDSVLDFEISKDSLQFNFSIPSQEKNIPLKEYQNLVKFLRMIKSSKESNSKLKLEMKEKESFKTISLTLNEFDELDSSFLEDYALLNNCLEIENHFMMDLSSENMFNRFYKHKDKINLVAGLLRGEKRVFKFEGEFDNRQTWVKETIVVPFTIQVIFGDFVTNFGFYAKDKINEERQGSIYKYKFESKNMHFVCSSCEPLSKSKKIKDYTLKVNSDVREFLEKNFDERIIEAVHYH